MTPTRPSHAAPPRCAAPAGTRLARQALLLATALAVAPAWADSARYALDPVHTRVQFAVSHAGFSQAIGTVSGSTGSLEFDPDDWNGARLEVSVPLLRLDLGDPDWNRAALARNLLDGGRWPDARFVSTRVEPLAPDRFIVHGQLTLHGVTREVPLAVTFNALRRHPLPPFRRTAGFSATAAISRREFGIDAWPTVIGDRVELRIEAEATRARGDDDGDDGAGAPSTAPAEDAPRAPAAPTEPQEPSPP
ncbi:YceI family protein [Pseudoxanthomonas sp. 10H]|uniref:YceI family protein n=1 Tax=Pseudoxanthomonas sp. 10H TaxID=3242729 RepID=UPI003555F383